MADETNNTEQEGAEAVVELVPIAYTYDASKNPRGAFLPGIPHGTITQEKYDATPEWIQRSIDASPMYIPTKPASEKNTSGTNANKPKPTRKKKAAAKEQVNG